jgi:hypothetical protein
MVLKKEIMKTQSSDSERTPEYRQVGHKADRSTSRVGRSHAGYLLVAAVQHTI